jgi:hypothetical protein
MSHRDTHAHTHTQRGGGDADDNDDVEDDNDKEEGGVRADVGDSLDDVIHTHMASRTCQHGPGDVVSTDAEVW